MGRIAKKWGTVFIFLLLTVYFLCGNRGSVYAQEREWYEDYTYRLDTGENGTENYIYLKSYNKSAKSLYVPAVATIGGIGYRTGFAPENASIWDAAKEELVSIEFEKGCVVGDGAGFLFCGLEKLENVNVEVFDMSDATSTAWMFSGCKNLRTLQVKDWDLSKVTNMFNMFGGCEQLSNLEVGQWNTSNVTVMVSVFDHCRSLSHIEVEDWDVSKVTTINSMFYRCEKLQTLDLHKWNTSNITDMWELFGRCYSLRTINVKGWDTSNVVEMAGMFCCNYSLTSVDLSSFDMSKVKFRQYDDDMFTRCGSLNTIKTPKNVPKQMDLNVNLTYRKKVGNKPGKKEYTYIPEGKKSIVLVCNQSKSKKTSIKKITSSKGTITLSWKKVKGKTMFTPVQYEVQCSTNKDFSDSVGTVAYTTDHTFCVQDNVTERTSTKIKGLTKGKTYYVRVRVFTYEKRLSDWSNVKKIKVK